MKTLLSIILFVFLTPVFASATPVAPNINYTPLAPIPGTVTNEALCTGNPVPPSCKVANLGTYLRGIYITGVALAGLFVVFSIVRGGFTLLFTDSVLGKTEGKGMILHAIGGLLIVFSSFLLMNTINPQLGTDLNLNLSFPQKNIVPFVGKVQPLTNAELDALTLKNEGVLEVKRGNLAYASREASDVMLTAAKNSRDQATTFRGQAGELEKKTNATAEEVQTAKDLRKQADDLDAAATEIEINALATRTAAVANSYYARGSVAAQNAKDGFGVKTEEYGKAETELLAINRWFENNIKDLKPYNEKSSGEIGALLDHQMLQVAVIQQNLAKADIGGDSPDFVKAEAKMAAVKKQAEEAIQAIVALPPPTTDEDKALLASKKENIKKLANGMLNNLKSDCAALPTAQAAKALSCQNFALIP